MYKFSPKAKADLKAIAKYSISQFGQIQADRYLAELQEKLTLLGEYPEIGLRRPELAQNLFSCVCQSHTIFYQRHTDYILIVRILHQRMDHARILQ